jgi:hypothetical protein
MEMWPTALGYITGAFLLVAQVTTLLSKAEETEKEPKVTEEQLNQLEKDITAQGEAVADIKTVCITVNRLFSAATFIVLACAY